MNKEIGKIGEDLASDFLEKQGYIIVERNKHFSRFCELDIVAKYKNTYVFVEVKTRSTLAFGHPMEAITKTKMNNIKTGVFSYLKEKNLKNINYRIDVISVILKPDVKIEHLKNVEM
jgi:putative endonuclease